MIKQKITPSFRKIILKDWSILFPNLTIDPPASLSRRVGPLLIFLGFNVKSDRENYYPIVGVHNLSDPFTHLTSTLSTELEGSPSFFSVRSHEEGKYIEAAERMKKQSPLLLEGEVSLKMIINAYKNYLDKGGTKSISLLQDPVLIAAWAGRIDQAQKSLDCGYQEFKTWSENSQAKYGGLEGWLSDMQERIANPEKLRAIVREQAEYHKVEFIPTEELIVD